MKRACSVLRVFTRDGEGGNHLGVITDLDRLDTAGMQLIATKLGFSETVFIEDGAPPSVRIFTPGMEMPFAGHPLVGAAYHLLESGSDATRIECGIGEVRIRRDKDVVWVDAPMYHENAYRDGGIFARRVRLPKPRSTWRVEMPLDYRIVEVDTPEDVARAAPNTDYFGSAHGLVLFSRDGTQVRMRFFFPGGGINEDPATGSAAVALATRLAAGGEPNGDATIYQGEEIGHPSLIQLHWEGRIASIGGTVAEDEPMELSI